MLGSSDHHQLRAIPATEKLLVGLLNDQMNHVLFALTLDSEFGPMN